MSSFTMAELVAWNQRLEGCAREAGLDFYPQEFEICSYEAMLGYEAYTGMPSHYPHWSYGKAFDRLHTLYRLNLTGLPYEMVINSNPCLAYLMRDNGLLLQILTMAHVYGHNDFFKGNRMFSHTRPELTVEMFKNHAERVRSYVQDPGIGYAQTERILDAAHAVRFQTNRMPGARQLTTEERKQRLLDDYYSKLQGENRDSLNGPSSLEPPDLTKVPLEPEADLLGFILEYGRLNEWERDLVQIVRNETEYFLPQVETKILNEGWASFWHYKLLNRLELSPELHLEFLTQHHQVIRPVLGGLNPYHLGFTILTDLEERFGIEKVFEVRAIENDRSLIRRYLTRELCEKLHLFEYIRESETVTISEVADDNGWEKIRNTLCSIVGMGSVPVIKVVAVLPRDQTLVLEHEYDGRELELESAGETLKYLVELWGHPVHLKTNFRGVKTIVCDETKRLATVE
ncbi:MAG TPA: SpoVR family protein [Bacillota bacterium]